MKKWQLILGLLAAGMILVSAREAAAKNTKKSLVTQDAREASGQNLGGGLIRQDQDLLKDPFYWRSNPAFRGVPVLGIRVGTSFIPNYFSPGNATVEPYLSSSFGFSIRAALVQAGVRGYWSDLGMSIGWGFSKALTENIMGGQYARQLYARNIGIGFGKRLFVERNTGISVSMGLGFTIPVSLRSQQSTLITSISPTLSVGKTFFGRLSVGYSASASFNFYRQDSGLYNPELAGIPGLNRRWGMNHAFSLGLGIVRGLSVSAGLAISVGYTFADAYQNADGPQVFGGENLTAADLSSYSINESNGYSVFFSVSYRLNRFFRISASYANGGRQYEFQFNDKGERVWVIRNPFRLQNGSFSLGLSASI